MHQRKINRAIGRSAVGRFPATAEAMLMAIPDDVVSCLPSASLAGLLDAMASACAEAKRLATRDMLAEGAVWDGERLREIAA